MYRTSHALNMLCINIPVYVPCLLPLIWYHNNIAVKLQLAHRQVIDFNHS